MIQMSKYRYKTFFRCFEFIEPTFVIVFFLRRKIVFDYNATFICNISGEIPDVFMAINSQKNRISGIFISISNILQALHKNNFAKI